jgi:hypothetical protein
MLYTAVAVAERDPSIVVGPSGIWKEGMAVLPQAMPPSPPKLRDAAIRSNQHSAGMGFGFIEQP